MDRKLKPLLKFKFNIDEEEDIMPTKLTIFSNPKKKTKTIIHSRNVKKTRDTSTNNKGLF